jgi:polysaccharide transporter, PST family
MLPGPPLVSLLIAGVLAYGLMALMISVFATGRATLREGWELAWSALRRLARPAGITRPRG